ncbi:hypothetical protein EO763_16950 [Pectobacterium odoriferum]|uniref:ATP-binding protein n=1 Tax=Pectobacterium odoriferum TaxID=78398 RepID=UPI0013745E87|nr:ATP-binding protein [Pectobacterium odoriferum]QHP81453.1 hypothetical protein EO763_16950 [Pectobacterium odoriferum]
MKYRSSKVFVPGGMPQLTYIERTEGEIRKRLEGVKDNLCKLVTLTGQTKSGKTVLTQMVFPSIDENNIWIEGGSVNDENDLWAQVLVAINAWQSSEFVVTDTATTNIQGKASASASALVVKGSGEISVSQSDGNGSSTKESRSVSAKTAALKALQQSGKSLVIDDFHYLPRELQGNFVRAIKPLVFHGISIILIAIPHRRYDAIKVEREITGRLENIQIPYWSMSELRQIAEKGFPLLNMAVDDSVMDRLCSEALGSPHLMQEFCRALCQVYGVLETSDNIVPVKKIDDTLFKKVAEATGKTVFDKLATGPRQRSDRMARGLKNGERVDIYKVVLYALSRMKPGMETIQYESLRGAIREIVADAPPQAHEVTRVLEKMSEIASSDEASTPVIDWEKEEQKLHITDPFFAFYLKWRDQ